MNKYKMLPLLCWLIVGLAAVAAGGGVGTAVLGQSDGARFSFTTLHGQAVAIQGNGLYRFDTVAMAAQAVAQDLVTLVLAIPLLIAALLLSARHSLRGVVLRAGTLGYFLAQAALPLLAAPSPVPERLVHRW